MEEVTQITSCGKRLVVKESMTCVRSPEKPDFKRLVRRNDTISKRKTKIKEILVIASKSKSLSTTTMTTSSSSDDKMNQTENRFVELLTNNLSSSPLQMEGGNRHQLIVKELSNTLENEKSIAAFIKKFLDEEQFKLMKPISCGCEKLKERIDDVAIDLGKLRIELDELRASVRVEREMDAKANAKAVEDVRNDLETKLVKVEKGMVEENRELRTEIILCQSRLNDYSKADYKHYPVWTFAAFLAVYSIIYWTRRS